jgi:hypothetical protein
LNNLYNFLWRRYCWKYFTGQVFDAIQIACRRSGLLVRMSDLLLWRNTMNIKSFSFAALSMLLTNVAMAGGTAAPLPLDDAGMLAVAGTCLVIAVRIAQRKRSR